MAPLLGVIERPRSVILPLITSIGCTLIVSACILTLRYKVYSGGKAGSDSLCATPLEANAREQAWHEGRSLRSFTTYARFTRMKSRKSLPLFYHYSDERSRRRLYLTGTESLLTRKLVLPSG